MVLLTELLVQPATLEPDDATSTARRKRKSTPFHLAPPSTKPETPQSEAPQPSRSMHRDTCATYHHLMPPLHHVYQHLQPTDLPSMMHQNLGSKQQSTTFHSPTTLPQAEQPPAEQQTTTNSATTAAEPTFLGPRIDLEAMESIMVGDNMVVISLSN